jgi:exodeoxyribonuclease V alpha subunit
LLTAADVHVASTLGRLCGESSDLVLLVRPRRVPCARARCASTSSKPTVRQATSNLTGLEPRPAGTVAMAANVEQLRSSRSVSTVHEIARCAPSTDRSPHRYGRGATVRAELDTRTPHPAGRRHQPAAAVLGRLFAAPAPDLQRLAVAACVTGWVTVVAGPAPARPRRWPGPRSPAPDRDPPPRWPGCPGL